MHGTLAPSPWIVRWTHLVPAGGDVLDLACGGGRHVRWFAERGHAVTAVDRDGAALDTLAGIARTVEADIESGPWPLAGRQFAAVIVTNYLWRPLFGQIAACVAPGGVLYDRTGSYDVVWYLAILLGVFAALVNLPVREAPIARGGSVPQAA